MPTGSSNGIERSLCIPEYSHTSSMPIRFMPLVLWLQTALQDRLWRASFHCSVPKVRHFLLCHYSGFELTASSPVYNGLGMQWASRLLAFLTLAMLPFPLPSDGPSTHM